MAASDIRSSARVAPRSVSREAAISLDDRGDVGGVGVHRAGAGHVADGAVAHDPVLRRSRLRAGRPTRPGTATCRRAANTSRSVRVVDLRQLDLLLGDVLPDVELGPVRQREHPHVLAGAVPAVVQPPQLGALPLAGPTGRSRRAARRPAPSRGPSPRRGGRRRRRRRTCATGSRRAAARSAAGCGCRRGAPPGGRRRCSPARARRTAAARARRPCGRGRPGPRGSCGRCPRAAARRAPAPARTPSTPGAASRSSPCRRRTAAPAARTRPRPRGRCGRPRPPASADGRAPGRSRRG